MLLTGSSQTVETSIVKSIDLMIAVDAKIMRGMLLLEKTKLIIVTTKRLEDKIRQTTFV